METGIYVRVSTEEQVKEGYSIRAQEQKLKDYARVKDWQIYDVYIDEGISGKNITARPEVNRLIADVKSGKVNNVLVFKIDRLTRSTSDLIYLVELFNKHECTFNSLMESIDTQTASGRMFLKIIGTFAEFERENIAERIVLGRERKVKEGYTLCSHIASFGYDRPKGQKIQTIIESEAEIVREIFDWYVNRNENLTQIARKLNLRGILTKRGNKWTTTGVKNILSNNNYMGDVRHHFANKERAYTVKGQHEQIITSELFKKAQHKLNKIPRISPRKQPTEKNYFAGFLICAQCGNKLHPYFFYRKTVDGTERFYGNWGCGNTTVGECDVSTISTIKLEKALNEYLQQIAKLETDDPIHTYEQEQARKEKQTLIETYEEKLKKVEAKAREALDSYIDNIFSVEDYRKMKRRLDNDKKAICNELESLRIDSVEVADNKLEIAKTVHENWKQFSDVEKRLFLMQFVEKIIVENKRIGLNKKGRMQRQVRISDIVFCGG